MSKRILALILCVIMLVPLFTACNPAEKSNELGAYITMYITDDIYDFDPANAYYNSDAMNIVSLMFDTLFKLDENGKIKGSLVDSYTINEDTEKNEYTMLLTLKETKWSNGTEVTAEDIVYAWKRLLKSTNNYQAASLLYDIKNARAVKEGELSIDDLKIEGIEKKVLKIQFEGKIDYDRFLLNLTNLATAPLLEANVNKNTDWAKKASTIATSGPFKLGKTVYEEVKYLDEAGVEQSLTQKDDYKIDENGKITSSEPKVKRLRNFYLERNVYYYRDTQRDSLASSVSSYRLLVDCTKTAEELQADFNEGRLFYIGNIPASIRGNNTLDQKKIQVSNALSTFSLFMNEKALIADGGEGSYLFANENVRKALSLAIDRQAIANAVVYAEAATALVPSGLFDTTRKTDFRANGGAILATGAQKEQALALLNTAGIVPSNYTFTIKVPTYDDTSILMAKMIAEAWGTAGLGFNVSVEEVLITENNDYLKETGSTPTDICDDRFIEAIQQGKFEVIAFDYVAYSVDAYSMLAPFAKAFSGTSMNIDVANEIYEILPHVTGYDNEKYNNLMEAIYYIPYFAGLTETSSDFLGLYNDNPEEYKALYNAIKAIYAENGITPTTKSSEWTKQKSILLHKAEQLLLETMPIIPVVFNKNAVVVSDLLTNVDPGNYYFPVNFRKTSLKDYKNYVPALEDFPTIDWSLKLAE